MTTRRLAAAAAAGFALFVARAFPSIPKRLAYIAEAMDPYDSLRALEEREYHRFRCEEVAEAAAEVDEVLALAEWETELAEGAES